MKVMGEMNEELIEEEPNKELSQEEYYQTSEDLLNDRLREVDFDTDNKLDLTETDEFQNGLAKALYYAGFYTGLRNYGMVTTDAYNMTLNEHTCNHNLDLAKVKDKQNKDLDNTNVIGFQYTPESEYDDYDEDKLKQNKLYIK